VNTVIRLCGSLAAEFDGRRIERALPGRQGRMVFAYLVLHRARTVSRDELIEALWPDTAPESAGALLTGLLSRLRRALPAGTIGGRARLSFTLPADAWIDVEAAGRAAERALDALDGGDPAAAASIARAALAIAEAPLLADLDRAWLSERRRELDGVVSGLLEVVARAGIEAGGSQLVAAEAAARQLIEREPLRESAHELLMEALAARGDVAQALELYDRLRTLLRDELGAVPGARVRALSEHLLRHGELPIAPPRRPAARIENGRHPRRARWHRRVRNACDRSLGP
jgi:DNA-binding SARP family transcriptional activator